MRWAEPGWLVLLGLAVLPALTNRWRRAIGWPTLDGFKSSPASPSRWRRGGWRAALPWLLRGAALACVVAGLARPQTVAGRTRIAGQGVVIVVALDHSSSMKTADFPDDDATITRLDAAKRTLERFVAGRPDDLLGLVVFANVPDPDLGCPPTLAHAFVIDAVRSVRPARPGDDGTNLGDAMIVALDDLTRAAPSKKVLVLLTDGRNAPAVPNPTDPKEAAEIARGLGVTVHTIAVGKSGAVAPGAEPGPRPEESEGPDFALLEQLAAAAGGRSFLATDARALERVFTTIDALEKSPVRGEVRTRYRERYTPWVAAALGLIVVDRWLAAGRFRALP